MNTFRYCASVFVAVLLGLTGAVTALGQSELNLITYGSDAPTIEGDSDYRQNVFFRFSQPGVDTVYIRVFDPDIGGTLDALSDGANGSTRFALFSLEETEYRPRLQSDGSPDDVIDSGSLVAEETFRTSGNADGSWNTLFSVPVSAGGSTADTLLRLLIDGLTGDDGNVFNVALSTSPTGNTPPPDLEVFSFGPTFRIPTRGLPAILSLQAPDIASSLVVSNYDAAGATVTLESIVRPLAVTSSGQGEWTKASAALLPEERGQPVAVTLGGDGSESPNDVSVFVTTANGSILPVSLPVLRREIGARPTVVVSAEPLSDCSSVAFDAEMGGNVNYDQYAFNWSFGDGASGTGRSLVHGYEATGDYSARLVVTDATGRAGNGALAETTVLVKTRPTVDAGADRIVAPGVAVDFRGSASTSSAYRMESYSWDFNDGGSAMGEAVSHVFQAPGRYLVTLRAQDSADHPCSIGSDQLNVIVNDAPVAEAGENLNASVGDVLRLDGTRSYDTDGEIARYEWDMGDGTQVDGAQIEHVYTTAGRYEIVLAVTDNTTVENNTDSDRIFIAVNDPPVARAGEDKTAAVGEVISFDADASSDSDGAIVGYSWDFGDGGSASDANATYAYRSPGTYTVRLTVRDNSISRTGIGRDSFVVVVNSPPIAAAGEDQYITESVVYFDGTASSDADGEVSTYRWDFGDGNTGSGPRPSHVYGLPDTYRVRLEVLDNSGTIRNEASDEMVVTVNAAPVADAGQDHLVSPGQEILFDGGSSVDLDGSLETFEWDFGDGNRASGIRARHSYEKPGTYVAHLNVADDTGHERAVDSDEAVVVVNARPNARAGADMLVAPDQEIQLDGRQSFDTDGQIASFQWDIDGGIGQRNEVVTTFSYPAPGRYSAQLTVDDGTGTDNAQDEDHLDIRVNAAPIAVTVPEITSCAVTIPFDGTTSTDPDGDPLTYAWDFGDGSEERYGPTVSHTFREGGSYPVTLTIDDGTGLDNSRHATDLLVSINRNPLAVAGRDTTVCAGEYVIFDGSASADPEGGLLKYEWDFGDDTSEQGINPTKMYRDGSIYPVRLTVRDDSGMMCNEDVDEMLVRVVESPIAEAGDDQTVCANMPVLFDGSASRDADGVVNRFAWDFGDGSTGGGVAPSHIFTEPGTYRVRLTILGDQVGQCDNEDSDEVVITVMSAPTASFSAPANVAIGETVTFDGSTSSSDTGTVEEWEWDYGDGSTGTGETSTHRYQAPGRYVATLTLKAGGGSNACAAVSSSQLIVVNAPPVADAGADQDAAPDEEVVLSAARATDTDGGIASYAWDFADGSTGSGMTVRHRFREPGTFPVVLTVTDDVRLSNSTDRDTVIVRVNAAPRPVITVSDNVCPGTGVSFDASSSSDRDGDSLSYSWFFGDGSSSNLVSPVHTFEQPGTYQVLLRADDGTGLANQIAETEQVVKANIQPTAEAGPDIRTCPAEPVTFDGSASTDMDGEITRYSWAFGDGSEDSGESVAHTYRTAGTYASILRITDDSGTACGMARDTALIWVNARPVAEAGPDREAFVGGAHDAVVFDGSASTDEENMSLKYTWDFGDGGRDSGRIVRHEYTDPGTYTVRLTVSDPSGTSCATATDETTVTVRSRE